MVRTKADCGGGSATRKAVAARAPRKALGSSTSTAADGSSPSGNKYGGGNPVCPRPTPQWQKGITNFFINGKKDKENSAPATITSEDIEDEPVAGGSGASGDKS
ncbi:PCNA-associated factor [Patella vulgata]|uniref:PCNA-associated factor n=1 Tax=Patella caerulea TaxID=87958 RepID=A0AAN8JH82_PATCE|nr:PCNA-associated factor [Patella vulgata]